MLGAKGKAPAGGKIDRTGTAPWLDHDHAEPRATQTIGRSLEQVYHIGRDPQD